MPKDVMQGGRFMRKNNGGTLQLAIGWVVSAFALIAGLFLLILIYTESAYSWGHADRVDYYIKLFLPIMAALNVGTVFLAIGYTLKLTYIPEEKDYLDNTEKEAGNNQNQIETKTTEKSETKTTKNSETKANEENGAKPVEIENKNDEKDEKDGMIICPHCGREQRMNYFGCIYCHEKME